MYGEQILECTATSSHPPAVLIWFYHNSSGSVQKTTTENVIMEDSLMKVDAQPMSNLIITTETFPGIYGGKRVVSRLKLHNISRNYDGMLYVCVVKHIEWTESISRAYQLTVLYPPELKVTIMPQTWQERLKSSQTTLVCTVEGGQPRYFEGENEVLNMAGYGNMISGNNGSIFALNHALHDDKHKAGEYTCLLEGPAGIAQVTRHLEFAFPPELAPPRITLVTAAIGSQTVIELHIWAYPIPSSIYNLKGSKMKHRFVKHCNLQEIDPQILNEVNTQKKVYTWYKVTTKRTPSEIRILQKELIHENWIPLDREKQIYHNFNKQQRIWTDAILIELPYYETDEQINKNVSQNKKGLLRKIPTIIYRLFLSPLAENDYGEYLCEVEHETGRKQFFIQVQPPGNPPISVKNIRFIREQSYIRVYFDPLNFLRSIKGVTSHIDDSKNHILMTKSTVHVNKVRSLLSSSADDKKQQLEWKMVMVICPLYYSQRNKLSEHADNDCSSPHIKNSIQRKFNYDQWLEVYRLLPNIKYQTTLLSNECIEKLIEYPEQGRIEILLAYPYNHTVKNTSYREAETNFNETTKQSNLFVDKALPNDDQGIQVNWSNDEKLTYQFRFYDEVGSLTYSTEWYYEENDNYIEESAFSQFIHRKTYMWIIIAGVSIFPLLTILLILVLRKKLSIKKDFDTNFNQSLTPLNKSMINSAATSPIANCKLQDNFYVANFSVVDSPCSLISRNERLNSRQFSKISSMCNREVQKFPNDKYQSDNRHISNQNLHYNTLQKGEMINGENESINMPKNLFELRYNQLSLSHNQCSGEGLNDEIHSISPVTYSPIVSHFSPVPLIRSNEIIPSSSLLLYNTCCHNRKLGIEMNYSFPPLFGPMPILRNSQSPNTSSELSSPILGDGNKFRGRLPTSTNFCYHQHVQKLNNSKQNKRKPQEDTISQIAIDNKMNQSRVKQTTDDKNTVNTEKNLNCNNQATETLMNQTGNKYHVSQTDSCDGCKSFHQPNHSSLLLKNNLYATNISNFEVCVVDTDGANNTNIRNDNNQDDLGQFDANHDFINNNPQDITNDSDHCSMNYSLDNHNLSRMVYPSESDHLSSPLINNRQNSLIRNNQSSGLKGNLKMNKVDVNDIHYNTDQYLKKLNDVKMSTFNQNHSLFDRLSPYDNTTISSLTGNYNTPLANRVNIHSVEMYANKNLSNDSHFSGLTEKTNNDKKSCTINSVTTDNL
ncbi:unnamed protein product [Heterobilharzia americana]|nr:unnamed protein product [Heterobilharzia americana]